MRYGDGLAAKPFTAIAVERGLEEGELLFLGQTDPRLKAQIAGIPKGDHKGA